MQALLDDIETALANRATARDQRELYLETRRQVLDELLNWLQIACLIFTMQSGGKVSTALQQHGFAILERSSDGKPTHEDQPPPETPAG
ncbi:MAG: hypothetical protein H6636_10165 [Anaerolineales bacterium]|nr:hypothetical protein [Anaerolineales bacterium]